MFVLHFAFSLWKFIGSNNNFYHRSKKHIFFVSSMQCIQIILQRNTGMVASMVFVLFIISLFIYLFIKNISHYLELKPFVNLARRVCRIMFFSFRNYKNEKKEFISDINKKRSTDYLQNFIVPLKKPKYCFISFFYINILD